MRYWLLITTIWSGAAFADPLDVIESEWTPVSYAPHLVLGDTPLEDAHRAGCAPPAGPPWESRVETWPLGFDGRALRLFASVTCLEITFDWIQPTREILRWRTGVQAEIDTFNVEAITFWTRLTVDPAPYDCRWGDNYDGQHAVRVVWDDGDGRVHVSTLAEVDHRHVPAGCAEWVTGDLLFVGWPSTVGADGEVWYQLRAAVPPDFHNANDVLITIAADYRQNWTGYGWTDLLIDRLGVEP